MFLVEQIHELRNRRTKRIGIYIFISIDEWGWWRVFCVDNGELFMGANHYRGTVFLARIKVK